MQSKMNILGINMDCLSYGDMHRIFHVWLSDKESRSHSLALINVNCCVSALFDKSLVSLYNSADIVGIDGMPFLRWARAFYNKSADRFYAPDLMLEAARKSRECGYTFFLYGGSPGAPDKMEAYLRERCGEIRVVIEEGYVAAGNSISRNGDVAHQYPIADECCYSDAYLAAPAWAD